MLTLHRHRQTWGLATLRVQLVGTQLLNTENTETDPLFWGTIAELDLQKHWFQLDYLDLERKALCFTCHYEDISDGWEEVHGWSSYCFKSSPSSFPNSTNVCFEHSLCGKIMFIYCLQLLQRSYNCGQTRLELTEVTGHWPRLGDSHLQAEWIRWLNAETTAVRLAPALGRGTKR